MITTVQCSICSQLNNMPRVVLTDFRLHHTCSLIIVWLHSLSGVIRSLLCNPHTFSPAIMKSTKVQTLGAILTEMLHVLGEHTGMKLSCIKPMSKVRGLSIEPRSSTGCID